MALLPTALFGGLATIAEKPVVVMSFKRMDAGSVVPAGRPKVTQKKQVF